MSKKIIYLGVFLGGMALMVSAMQLNLTAMAGVPDAVKSETCECTKLAWMKLFKDPVNFVWNCHCGKIECLVTCKFGSPAISCVKYGMF